MKYLDDFDGSCCSRHNMKLLGVVITHADMTRKPKVFEADVLSCKLCGAKWGKRRDNGRIFLCKTH